MPLLNPPPTTRYFKRRRRLTRKEEKNLMGSPRQDAILVYQRSSGLSSFILSSVKMPTYVHGFRVRTPTRQNGIHFKHIQSASLTSQSAAALKGSAAASYRMKPSRITQSIRQGSPSKDQYCCSNGVQVSRHYKPYMLKHSSTGSRNILV